MNFINYDGNTALKREGALIEVRFALYDDKHGEGETAALSMLVDTGADRSLLSVAVPQHLLATPTQYVEVEGVTGDGPERWPVYPMSMLVRAQGGVTLSFRQHFVGAPLKATALAHQGLVGLDFLHFCNFVLDGPTQQFTLGFREDLLC